MAVSAIAGRLVAVGSSGANDSGVCGRAGSGSTGLQGEDSRRRTAQLQFEPAVKGMAVRVRIEESTHARAGAGVHGPDRNVVADGYAESGSHDAVAVLAGQSGSDPEAVQATATDRDIVQSGRDGSARRRRDEDSVASGGTKRMASGNVGKEVKDAG